MRVKRIFIERWRHFENVSISIDPDTKLICLIGTNGSGKSQILELIAASANQIGLSQGFEAWRGDPYAEDASFRIEFQIDIDKLLDTSENIFAPFSAEGKYESWDGSVVAVRSGDASAIFAGNCGSLVSSVAAARLISKAIRTSKAVHYLLLDADRAYPKTQVNVNELGGAMEAKWETLKKSRAHTGARTLYQEWFKYLLGVESQENNKHIADVRKAREKGEIEPTFVDKMESYKKSLQQVLPHLLFTGIDTAKREVKFDSTGIDLEFAQLSGGEREIAFLVGQIERFGLKHGLFIVDEPELHLNNELVRTWISFLKDSVQSGQVWLASHSMEVVEVAGRASSYLLERDGDRKVRRCSTLEDRPIISTLSRSIGSPAFSISGFTFLFVEGTAEIGERERFRDLLGNSDSLRILEAGSCGEVIQRVNQLRMISEDVEEELLFGGVVDKDWRDAKEVAALKAQGVHVLDVHEIENLFLYPPVVEKVIGAIGGTVDDYANILRRLSDERAGSWIFGGARANERMREFPPACKKTRELVVMTTWTDLNENAKRLDEIVSGYSGLDNEQAKQLSSLMDVRMKIYRRIRGETDLWKRVEGKEISRALPGHIGLNGASTLEKAVLSAWADDPNLVPPPLSALRSFVNVLRQD